MTPPTLTFVVFGHYRSMTLTEQARATQHLAIVRAKAEGTWEADLARVRDAIGGGVR